MAGVTGGSARVLIVDDKPDIRSVVAMRLRAEPLFDVVGEAADGAEAIARVGELRPHVMILDLQMPVMSGEEVIPIVRSLAPRLRILVFSAYAGTQQRLRATERPDAEVRKGGELPALVGVFLALHEPIQLAARSGWDRSNVCFATRLEAGRAARRALAAIPPAEAAPLEPLRSRLLSGLPDGC